MIELNIDSQNEILDFDKNKSIAQILDTISSKIPATRLVTSINLDGHRIFVTNPPTLESFSNENLSKIEVKTVDREIWAATGLDICQSCVDRIQPSFIKVADLFRDSDFSNANKLFIHCIEGLERFIESLIITRVALKLNFHLLLSPEGYKLNDLEDNLNSILSSILNHQENKNYLEIAEKIEYELLPNLVSWKTSLSILRNSYLYHSN